MESTGIVCRRITKDEFDRLYDLFPDDDRLWRKYREKRMGEFDRGEIDVYVLEGGAALLGELTVNYVSHDLPTETIPGRRVYLQAFRVEERYQGEGLGQRLLQFALADLERRGYTEFTIGVEEENGRAKHIYEKWGFTEAIDRGCGDELDPTDYTLYLRRVEERP